MQVIETVKHLPMSVGEVDDGSLAHGVEDPVGRLVIVRGGFYGQSPFSQLKDAAVLLLQPRVRHHEGEQVCPEPRSVGDLIVVQGEVWVREGEHHTPHSRELPQAFLPQEYFSRVVGGGGGGEELCGDGRRMFLY